MKKDNLLLFLFPTCIIAILFLPRLVSGDTHVDALCYSSISRNLSIGIGSFWKPFFSNGFWLPYNSGSVFYEHPPMLFWIQSLFFKIIGDYWITDRIFSLCVLISVIYYLFKIWKLVCLFLNKKEFIKYFAFVVCIFYIIPVNIYIYPINLLDSFITLFPLISIYLILKYYYLNNNKYWLLFTSGIFIIFAFLTKGPIGVFPISLPFIYYIVYKNKSLTQTIINTFILVFTCLLIFLILYNFIPDAKIYFINYFNQQVLKAIEGNREVNSFGRFRILFDIFIQCLIFIIFFIIWFIINKFYKNKITFKNFYFKEIYFFFLIFLSASLPIMVSIKQNECYLGPSLPYLALTFSLIALPVIYKFYLKFIINKNLIKNINYSIILILLFVLIYTFNEYKKPNSDKYIIEDCNNFSKWFKKNNTIVVSEYLNSNPLIHGFLQKNYLIQLSTNIDSNKIIFIENQEIDFKNKIDSLGYNILFKGNKYSIYKYRNNKYY